MIEKKLSKHFLKYWLNFMENHIKLLSSSNTQDNLNADKVKNMPLFLPSFDEQEKIARYLDSETQVIKLIEEKYQNLIYLLKEKRIALITHAVTKGINPHVKMKDSGNEWIDKVPMDCEAIRIKFVTSKIGSGKTPTGGGQIYLNEGVMLIRSQNVYDDGLRLDDVVYINEETNSEMKNTQVYANDILLNITGASIGRSCLVPSRFSSANVNQHVCIIRLHKKYSHRYVAYCMKSRLIKEKILSTENGTSREGLTFPQVANLMVVIPSKF